FARLRRAEASGWAVEAGGLLLRPDALPRGAESRRRAEALAGTLRPASVPGTGKAPRLRGSLARTGMQGHNASSQPACAEDRMSPSGSQGYGQCRVAAQADAERPLPGLRVPAAMP